MENQIIIRAGMKRHKGSFLGIGILLFLTALCLTTVLMLSLVGNRYIREEMERAGWSNVKIADEMGMNPQSVANAIYQHKKKCESV